jgi:hypothetical protein
VPGHLFVCVIRVPVCARVSRVSPAITINFVRNSTKLEMIGSLAVSGALNSKRVFP